MNKLVHFKNHTYIYIKKNIHNTPINGKLLPLALKSRWYENKYNKHKSNYILAGTVACWRTRARACFSLERMIQKWENRVKDTLVPDRGFLLHNEKNVGRVGKEITSLRNESLWFNVVSTFCLKSSAPWKGRVTLVGICQIRGSRPLFPGVRS